MLYTTSESFCTRKTFWDTCTELHHLEHIRFTPKLNIYKISPSTKQTNSSDNHWDTGFFYFLLIFLKLILYSFYKTYILHFIFKQFRTKSINFSYTPQPTDANVFIVKAQLCRFICINTLVHI